MPRSYPIAGAPMPVSSVDEYIKAQQSPQREICHKLREIILRTFPSIKEGMKWGVPSYGDGVYYLVALKDHVNLGVSLKGIPVEKRALLDVIGKTTGHVEFASLGSIDEARVSMLLNLPVKRP